MRKFDILANILWEGAKVRLDPRCWKNKKLGNPKTKMKGGVRVNNCVPKESKQINENSQYQLLSGAANLPPYAPRGFWIKGGKYIVVNDMHGHDQAIEQVFPELVAQVRGIPGRPSLHSYCIKKGFIHVGRDGSSYELTYNPLYASKSDIKLAKDIGHHYQKDVIDHFERYLNESRFSVVGKLIFKDPNGTGPKYQDVNTTVNATSEGQAALFAAKQIAKKQGFRNSYYHVGRGYRVTKLPDELPPTPSTYRLPYKDDE